jgi:hypothetical protein
MASRTTGKVRITAAPRRWPAMPMRIAVRRRKWMVSSSVLLRKAMASLVAGAFLRWPALRRKLRMAVVTSPKSMSTGQGFLHLWHTVQWSATSSNSAKWARDTPRRVCSS